MSYYQGDYYQGDIWGNIGKAIKKGVRDIGRAAKPLAPLAGLVVPMIGVPAALAAAAGRGAAVVKSVKAARDLATQVRAQNVQPTPYAPAPVIMSALTGQTVGMPAQPDDRVRSYRPRLGTEEAVITDHEEWKRWMKSGASTDSMGRPVIPRATKRRTTKRRATRRRRTNTRARSRSRSRSRSRR